LGKINILHQAIAKIKNNQLASVVSPSRMLQGYRIVSPLLAIIYDYEI
jgi:hypothetical protein